jgi:predicted ATP-dependent endonuclease of OLD family
MKKLVSKLAQERQMQLFVAKHRSHISSRLDLRSAILPGKNRPISLHELSEDTARFLMKTLDNNVPDFAPAQRVILAEDDAEFIFTYAFYPGLTSRAPEHHGVHIISIGGTSFRRYPELARLPENRVAAVRDNDGDYQQNCVERFAEILSPDIRVFGDENPDRSTFEICLYQDNVAICEQAFGCRRSRLSVQDCMLANKAEAAFEMLELNAPLSVPTYIREAVTWISA